MLHTQGWQDSSLLIRYTHTESMECTSELLSLQVHGYSNHDYKAFDNFEDAEAYSMYGRVPASPNSSMSSVEPWAASSFTTVKHWYMYKLVSLPQLDPQNQSLSIQKIYIFPSQHPTQTSPNWLFTSMIAIFAPYWLSLQAPSQVCTSRWLMPHKRLFWVV